MHKQSILKHNNYHQIHLFSTSLFSRFHWPSL